MRRDEEQRLRRASDQGDKQASQHLARYLYRQGRVEDSKVPLIRALDSDSSLSIWRKIDREPESAGSFIRGYSAERYPYLESGELPLWVQVDGLRFPASLNKLKEHLLYARLLLSVAEWFQPLMGGTVPAESLLVDMAHHYEKCLSSKLLKSYKHRLPPFDLLSFLTLHCEDASERSIVRHLTGDHEQPRKVFFKIYKWYRQMLIDRGLGIREIMLQTEAFERSFFEDFISFLIQNP
jgi:hypothetical protein